jgi:hypothetical protein
MTTYTVLGFVYLQYHMVENPSLVLTGREVVCSNEILIQAQKDTTSTLNVNRSDTGFRVNESVLPPELCHTT